MAAKKDQNSVCWMDALSASLEAARKVVMMAQLMAAEMVEMTVEMTDH